MGHNPPAPPRRSDELRGFGVVYVPEPKPSAVWTWLTSALFAASGALFVAGWLAVGVGIVLGLPGLTLLGFTVGGAGLVVLSERSIRRDSKRSTPERIRALERANDQLDVELAALGVPRDGIRLSSEPPSPFPEPTMDRQVYAVARSLRSNERGYMILPPGYRVELKHPPPPKKPLTPTYRRY